VFFVSHTRLILEQTTKTEDFFVVLLRSGRWRAEATIAHRRLGIPWQIGGTSLWGVDTWVRQQSLSAEVFKRNLPGAR